MHASIFYTQWTVLTAKTTAVSAVMWPLSWATSFEQNVWWNQSDLEFENMEDKKEETLPVPPTKGGREDVA